MNQLYIYIYPHISSLLHLPPFLLLAAGKLRVNFILALRFTYLIVASVWVFTFFLALFCSCLCFSHLKQLNCCWCSALLFSFFVSLEVFIYLFMAVLGLSCCTRVFSSCNERGLLIVAVCGLLIAVASHCRA